MACIKSCKRPVVRVYLQYQLGSSPALQTVKRLRAPMLPYKVRFNATQLGFRVPKYYKHIWYRCICINCCHSITFCGSTRANYPAMSWSGYFSVWSESPVTSAKFSTFTETYLIQCTYQGALGHAVFAPLISLDPRCTSFFPSHW